MKKLDAEKKKISCAVPTARAGRDQLRQALKCYVAREDLNPPLTIEELREHVESLVDEGLCPAEFSHYAMVLLNNEVWRDTVAATPCDRRLLLLPQCLRSARDCPAEMDEFGLLCEECGRCPIGGLQAMAEELGYIVLVAEGITVVTKLLDSRKVDTVIGVSCLSALEESFPKMTANAIPGLAIPLHVDGCVDTKVDLEHVRTAINMRAPRGNASLLNTEHLSEEVLSWFQKPALLELLDSDGTQTEAIAYDWLARDGKRWRPFLLASVFYALRGVEGELPVAIQRLAVAVECFHKASLVHDDIEDNDDHRYGVATVHHRHGIPIALNVGDFLIGVGYRLISECGLESEKISMMLAAAAENHCALSLGQGEELHGCRQEQPFSVADIMDVFRRKTAPAFGLALQLGAIAGGGDNGTRDILQRFSVSLGEAYQINDDLYEYCVKGNLLDTDHIRPSLLMALAYEQSSGGMREELLSFWQRKDSDEKTMSRLRYVFNELMVEEKARQLKEHCVHASVRTLGALRNENVKSFLMRLVGKILKQV